MLDNGHANQMTNRSVPLEDPSSLDLLSLAEAPMGERIAVLETAASVPDEGDALQPLAVQVANLVLAEAVRLIRLGTREELTEAADELARLMISATARSLARLHPEAHRLASGATVALIAAGAPQSPGAEEAVLRSWSGRALRAVSLLYEADGHSLPRAELRRALGDPEESYLSHLLADLEGAGLAIRIREGRTVRVHLGPTAREEHVRRRVAPAAYPRWGKNGPDRDPGPEPGALSVWADVGLDAVLHIPAGAFAHGVLVGRAARTRGWRVRRNRRIHGEAVGKIHAASFEDLGTGHAGLDPDHSFALHRVATGFFEDLPGERDDLSGEELLSALDRGLASGREQA